MIFLTFTIIHLGFGRWCFGRDESLTQTIRNVQEDHMSQGAHPRDHLVKRGTLNQRGDEPLGGIFYFDLL